ncbi:MAG TPA: hypothetical protein VIH42_01775 [Thermoguttaceae bacterium]|nr:hypothetical protein [Sedimentisphaerales bacterium]
MKRQNVAFSGWWVLALRLVFVFCALFGSTYCRAEEIAVLIEQSPPKGGEVAGGTGVRYYPAGTYIRLLAIPRPGYQFVYWLGDVVDPLSMNTMAHLDGPMIIVAVYAKVPEDEPESTSPEIGIGAGSAEAGVRAAEPTPYPASFGAVGQVILEPSTIFLFGLAAVMLRRIQRRF